MSTNIPAQAEAPRVVTAQELAGLVGRPQTRMSNIAMLLFVVGAVQGFRWGWAEGAVPLMVGSVASVFASIVYGRQLVMGGSNAFANMFAALAGLVPYVFGCYLVFYRGFWGSRVLFHEFSAARLLASLAFIYLGFRLLVWGAQLTQLGTALRNGKMVVRG